MTVEQNASSHFGGSLRVVGRIVKHEGRLVALYRGLTPNLVGNSASWAFYFVWYDRMKHAFEVYHGHGVHLTHYDYFLSSATAGCRSAQELLSTIDVSSRYPHCAVHESNMGHQDTHALNFGGTLWSV